MLSILNRKQAIATLFFSAILLGINAISTKACAIPSERNILLERPPSMLHKATFMGKVKITRSTALKYMTLVRGILEESKTHPHLIDRKVTFIHEGTLTDYLCPMDIRAGYEGYVIGREMNLNTDALIIDPYVVDPCIGSIDKAMIYTDEEKFPLQHFY